MAKAETIVVSAETARDIRRMIEAGDFASTDDVVQAALAALVADTEDKADRLAWIKAQIRASVEDTRPGYSSEEVRQHLDQMLARAERRLRDSAA